MKATKVIYEKTFNLGNYQNEVIGIEIELAEGEKASEAFDRAKTFVEARHARGVEYEKAREIVDNPDNYTYRTVKEADKTLSRIVELNDKDDNLPF